MSRRARRSHELFAESRQYMPGGVSSPVRAMGQIGGEPFVVARGEGAELVDVDGNRYVDWVMSWGALLAGHAHPDIVAAVTARAASGTSYGAPTAGELELARLVVDTVPSVEMVRFVSSGTEAAMSALRLARAVTGKTRVLKFAGAYHGHADPFLVAAGSGLATHGIPASPGVPEGAVADTVVVTWNDRTAVDEALAGGDFAAIFCEPYPANMGFVPPSEGFLAYLRERADEAGALLVFDEVISGFRVAPGGAQEREGVTPDLTVLGKVIGGGLPLAAFGGPRRAMEALAPSGDVYQAGTLSGNPLATAAGRIAVELARDSAARAHLERISSALADGLRALGEEVGVPLTVTAAPGLVCPFFTAGPVHDFADVSATSAEAYAVFARSLLDQGIFVPPSRFEAWFPSLAHEQSHVERTLAAARTALRAVRDHVYSGASR